jgi:phosphatidyl-myo-inositol alpha-mannosyltransferase
MTKVLHLINGEFFAGAERVQDLLAQRLPETGHEVGFVCLKDGVFAKHRRSTCALEVLPMRSRMDLSIVKRIVEHARAGGYRIVHTHTPRSALIGQRVARQLGLPLVHHVHSPTQRDTESRVRNLINAAVEDHLVLPGASHLIAVSDSLRRYLREHRVPEGKISVVPNGVPVVRAEAGWAAPAAGQPWVVGTVALFRPRKGIEVLLKALRLLIDQGLPVRLKAVGTFETPAYETAIRQLATELGLDGHIVWTGFCRDVHAEMAGMQLFVLPSLFGEGLPMVVIEAMSMGVPVVASRVEGIPEVIGVDDAGIVVEPNDPASLAAGMAKLLSGRVSATEMAIAAHRRQRQHYSDTSMAAAVAEVYRRVLPAPLR